MQLTHGGSVLPVLLLARLPALLSAGGLAVFNESHEGGRDRGGGGRGGNGNLAASAAEMLEVRRFVILIKG